MKSVNKLINKQFVPPKRRYYIGKIVHGTPYFWPINFENTIISFRKLELNSQEVLDECKDEYSKKARRFKNMPMVRRSKDFIIKLLDSYYFIQIGWPIVFHKTELGWKDKWDTPRFEWNPSFMIFFFNWQFCIHWTSPDGSDDKYWEQILWYNIYCDCDIVKAKSTWSWINSKTNLSTWNDKYIISNNIETLK